ncbi:cyclin-T2a isoform X2 [Pangasianodon hypophthalmus]|uniref:cyclin-T2a isoform X2 n=1 Tax=Pangasianodon hypophthalmus TaxID=310915 RepID=UPI00230720A2|nr:cyclin-T2a isoform X2 [Pangasianodon hypophthalmus]
MAAHRGSSSKWFFSREQLEATPSRRCGVEPDRELSYRQQAANLIQDMGQRLNVSQLTINTAIVYMHRFYMYHSFTKFHRNIISPTTLFLAAKVEEQPRKLEHVIKVAHACLNPQEAPLDTKSNAYLQQAQELVILETIVLQTLGFEITIEHPHTDVVKCSQLVRASKDLAQTSYFMATNSLHLTTFCLQYRPTVIACVCIHLACKWSNWEIPVSTDGKHWWEYVDSSVTLELLDELTHEFLQILEKTPSKLKRIRNWRATQAAKKPKTDGPSSESSSFPGPSLGQDQSMVDAISGVSANATFSKPSTSFPISLPGSGLSLDHIASTVQGTSYTFTAPSDWPQDQARSDSYLLKQLPLHPHRPDKSAEFTTVKHEHKANKHQSSVYPPPPTSQPQKMSLEKYKEKHAAELAAQKRRQEQPSTESEARDSYGSSSQVEHRKPQQPYAHGQQGSSSSSTSTSSPLKMKLPLTGQEKVQGDKREKGSSLKVRLPVQAEKSGASKEELKMKIKVSSERHSSSDEGASKSKHSSPLVSKEKHRHHHKHGHSNPHSHSGGGSTLRSPMALGGEGAGTAPGSSSSRKRTHADGSHNHHSKKSKSSKPAAGGLRPSQHAGESGQGVSGEPWS